DNYAQIYISTDASAILLIEQDCAEEIVENDIKEIAVICNKFNASSVNIAETKEEAESLTAARRSALSTIARLRPTTFLEDATVPRSQVAPMEIGRAHV